MINDQIVADMKKSRALRCSIALARARDPTTTQSKALVERVLEYARSLYSASVRVRGGQSYVRSKVLALFERLLEYAYPLYSTFVLVRVDLGSCVVQIAMSRLAYAERGYELKVFQPQPTYDQVMHVADITDRMRNGEWPEFDQDIPVDPAAPRTLKRIVSALRRELFQQLDQRPITRVAIDRCYVFTLLEGASDLRIESIRDLALLNKRRMAKARVVPTGAMGGLDLSKIRPVLDNLEYIAALPEPRKQPYPPTSEDYAESDDDGDSDEQ